MATEEQLEKVYAKVGKDRDGWPRKIGETVLADGSIKSVFPARPAIRSGDDGYFYTAPADPLDVLYPSDK
jgi:hypothetical protein